MSSQAGRSDREMTAVIEKPAALALDQIKRGMPVIRLSKPKGQRGVVSKAPYRVRDGILVSVEWQVVSGESRFGFQQTYRQNVKPEQLAHDPKGIVDSAFLAKRLVVHDRLDLLFSLMPTAGSSLRLAEVEDHRLDWYANQLAHAIHTMETIVRESHLYGPEIVERIRADHAEMVAEDEEASLERFVEGEEQDDDEDLKIELDDK
jgi:hypothetical protein